MTQSDEVIESRKVRGSCVWRTQSDEVIDGIENKGLKEDSTFVAGHHSKLLM